MADVYGSHEENTDFKSYIAVYGYTNPFGGDLSLEDIARRYGSSL
jgi:hypothetical protein